MKTGCATAASRELDQWQATEVEVAQREHVEDLRKYAIEARDWRAYLTCVRALLPEQQGWTALPGELEARRLCTSAWNLRATRLRLANTTEACTRG